MPTLTGTSTLRVLRQERKMAEINYNPEDMMNENSASFKVFAYYALKSGIDRKIDILAEASTFGFTNLLKEKERSEFQESLSLSF